MMLWCSVAAVIALIPVNEATVYSPAPPSAANDTTIIPQIGFIVDSHSPLTRVVDMLNQAVYSHLLWNQAVEEMYFTQPPHEVKVVAEPTIHSMEARAYPLTEYKDLTFVASERCENTTPDNVKCELSPFVKTIQLETKVFNGKGVQIDRNRTLPVTFTVGSTYKTFTFQWEHTLPSSRARQDSYTFEVPHRTVIVPPRTSYIVEYEMRRTLVEGDLLLHTMVGTPISEAFFWAMETCAYTKGETTCVPIRYGDFYSKHVRHELNKGARAHLCGTHDPRFCAVSLGEDDKLHLNSKAQFRAGVDAGFKIRIWEENREGNTDRLISVINIDPRLD